MDNIKPSENDEQLIPQEPLLHDHLSQPLEAQIEAVVEVVKPKIIDILYEVTIEKDRNRQDMGSSQMSFSIQVKNNKIDKTWTISRKYEDFEWLYQALKISLPGYVLPYFPSPSVLKYLQQKFLFFNQKERSMFLISQKYELRKFIEDISKHQIYGFTEELRIFLIDNHEDYQASKRKIDNVIEKLNIHGKKIRYQENTALTLGGLWEKSKSWFGDAVPKQSKQETTQWKSVRQRIERYSDQLFTLIQKLCMFKRAKEDQNNWKGPTSSLDSVRTMQVNIENGKSFGQILNAEIQAKLMLPLIVQSKKEAQLRQMLTDKDDVEALILHLKRISGDESRLGSLELWGVKFQTHLIEGWEIWERQWLRLVQDMEGRFRNVFESYAKQIYKIWE